MSYPPVPYVSQIDNAPAKNDCGAACVMMACRELWRKVNALQPVSEVTA